MNIKTISVGITRKVAGPKPAIGMVKYETIDYSINAEASLTEDDNPHKVFDDILKFCKDKLGRELDRIDGIIRTTPLEEDYIPSTRIEDDDIPF